MSTPVEQAIEEIGANEDLARRFTENPEDVLKELGVDTENLIIQETSQAARALTNPSAGTITVCASIGTIVCASVGSDGQIAARRAPGTTSPAPSTFVPPPTTRG